MTCVHGDLRQVIFNGKNEILFKIPNFCICDPIFERNYDDIKNKNKTKVLLKINLNYIFISIPKLNKKNNKKNGLFQR